MRKRLMFIVGLAAFVLTPHVAAAVKLTSEQVDNVCGSKKQTQSNGVSGCTKACVMEMSRLGMAATAIGRLGMGAQGASAKAGALFVAHRPRSSL
jgi:hypothetical protein